MSKEKVMPGDGYPRLRLVVAASALFLTLSPPMLACHSGTPLVLDLNGDRVRTTGLSFPVRFDLDADGHDEEVGWTYAAGEEGFLWMDLNYNGVVDDGSELFGDATYLSTGRKAKHGFQALAEYDDPAFGGNRDRRVSPEDAVWMLLRLWVDRNHDGVSQPDEIEALSDRRVLSIDLRYDEIRERDGGGNWHLLRSTFTREDQWGQSRDAHVDDVFFVIRHEKVEHEAAAGAGQR